MSQICKNYIYFSHCKSDYSTKNFTVIDNYIENFLNFDHSLLKINFFPIFILFCFSVILSVIILSLSYIIAVQNPETEKLSSYECGFEPYEDARHVFDIKFYIVAILFLVFDLETVFLFPWAVSLSCLDIIGFWSMIDFILELGAGFCYIWYIKALDW